MLIVESQGGFRLISLKPSMVDAPNHWIEVPPETCRDIAVAEQVAVRISDWSKELQIPRKNVVLALSSHSCLFTRWKQRNTKTIQNAEARRYQLESELPFDAENLLADYHTVTPWTFAVAVKRDQCSPLVEALENQGLTIQHILPAVMLRLQHALQSNPQSVSPLSLWWEPSGMDLIRVEEGSVVQWRRVPADISRINAEIRWQQHSSQLEIRNPASFGSDQTESENANRMNGTADPIHGFVLDAQGSESEDDDFSELDIAPGTESEQAEFAIRWMDQASESDPSNANTDRWHPFVSATRSLLSRKWSPWFDIRRDASTSSYSGSRDQDSWKRTAMITALAGLVVVGALLWKAAQLESVASQQDDRIRDVYRKVFPDKRVPAAVLTGLRNTKRELARANSPSQEFDIAVPALQVLAQLLKNLPPDVPMEVDQIRIQNGRFSIQLDLPSLEDAGRVAAALQQDGLTVSPPATDTTQPNRVQAQIEGEWFDPIAGPTPAKNPSPR